MNQIEKHHCRVALEIARHACCGTAAPWFGGGLLRSVARPFHSARRSASRMDRFVVLNL